MKVIRDQLFEHRQTYNKQVIFPLKFSRCSVEFIILGAVCDSHTIRPPFICGQHILDTKMRGHGSIET